MGQLLHGEFLLGEHLKSNDCRAAYIGEMEFTETAHVLKMVAQDLEQSSELVINQLVRCGLDEALDLLSRQAGASASNAFYRRRGEWRADQTV